MQYHEIDGKDRELIAAAADVLERNYTDHRHTVGAAVLCASGKVYAAVNVDSCGFGPCAEPIAVGCAISAGERALERIVAVGGDAPPYHVIPPCGNCRQLLFDYAPDCMVLVGRDSKVVKARARDLLPDPYSNF